MIGRSAIDYVERAAETGHVAREVAGPAFQSGQSTVTGTDTFVVLPLGETTDNVRLPVTGPLVSDETAVNDTV